MTQEQTQIVAQMLIAKNNGFSVETPKDKKSWGITFTSTRVEKNLPVLGEFKNEMDIKVTISPVDTRKVRIHIGYEEE